MTKINDINQFNLKLESLIQDLFRMDMAPDGAILEQEQFELKEIFSYKEASIKLEKDLMVYQIPDTGERMVIHETYQNVEGGLTYLTGYARAQRARKWDHLLIESSLRRPDFCLMQTILHHHLDESFQDFTGSNHMHHYQWIVREEALWRQAAATFISQHKAKWLSENDQMVFDAVVQRLNS
jgi:hypothetical protein